MLEELKTIESIPYKLRISRRAKRMRVAVYADSSVVLTLPWGFKKTFAEKFIKQKFVWIKKSLSHFSKYKGRVVIKSGKREYLKHKAQALVLAKIKVEQWNKFYNFSYKNVSVKNQKTRWGSCSKRGNLNFNYKIVHLPEALVDYLIVHELCHLKEFNHSRNFWNLVKQTIPDCKNLRAQLRKWGNTVQ